MNYFIASVGIILFTWLVTSAVTPLKIPKVVGYILAGLLVNIAPIADLLRFPETGKFVSNMGDISLLFLMFLAGLETSTKELLHERKDAFAISICAAVTPFAIGFYTMYYLGYPVVTSAIVGISMSITGEATTAALLLDLKKIRTRMGTLMMEAGIVDDILGFGLFLIITFFLKETNAKEDILLSGAILAYFTGVLLQHRLNNGHVHLQKVKKWSFLLIVPFFFTSLGTWFDFQDLLTHSMLLFLFVLIGFGGKLVGTLLAKPFTTLTWHKLHMVGWAMNSRGATSLALILIALRSGLLDAAVYTNLVAMSILTTMAFPFMLIHMIKAQPGVMD